MAVSPEQGTNDSPHALAPGERVLRCDHLVVGYSGAPLLPEVGLDVRAGELWALVGPNGSGKTTLLRTLLGLLEPVTGEPRWSDAAHIGYVPQRSRMDLSIPARVVDVVRGGVDRAWSFLDPFFMGRRKDAIRRAMEDTNTAHLARQRFAELSEGQKQRVLMARALASDPQVLVLDEPTSAMDMSAEHDVFELIDRLRFERCLAVLLVSHHLPVVAEFATHVLLLDRECDMILAGPIEEVADHSTCRARYGQILREGIARRERHLCALGDQLDHIHGHDHEHGHHDHDHGHHCYEES